MGGADWTEEEVEFLRSNFPHRSNADLARALNRTPRSIIGKATRLGLSKTRERLREVGSENVARRKDRPLPGAGGE